MLKHKGDCSSKLEGLCRVRDGSTGELTDGYWYAGVSALTSEQKQPIPVYSRIYSSVEKDYTSNNTETLKSLKFLSSHFPKTTSRALDRGYDSGYVFDYFKISIVPVALPDYPDVKLNLVICNGLGKDPLLLLTNQLALAGWC